MSSIRVHGSVQPDADEFKIVFEIAGFPDKEGAMQVNSEIAAVIALYCEQRLGGVARDHGRGIPPWKVKQ